MSRDLGAYERRDGDLVKEAQHDYEKCNKAKVFIPSLKFPAILEEWGDGRGRNEGDGSCEEREILCHFSVGGHE